MTLAEELKSRNFSEFMTEVSLRKGALLTALRSRYIRTMVSAKSPFPPLPVYWKEKPQVQGPGCLRQWHTLHI